MRTPLLILVLFCAGIDAIKALIRAELATYLKPTELTGLTNARLLRSKTRAWDGEERGPNGGWVSELAEADRKVWKLRRVDMWLSEMVWLKIGRTPEYIFNYFNRIHNTWAKIERNKKTVQWFRFTQAYRAKWGAGRFTDEDVYNLLRTKVPEDKLAIVFESLKQIPDLKTLAETMQNYQFRLWITRKETQASVATILNMRRITPLTAERDPKDEILSAFTTMLNKLEGR